MTSFRIDWLEVFNTGNYRLTKVDGLDSPEYRTSAYDNAGADGGTVAQQLYGTRIVTLEGEVEASTPEQYKLKRRDLMTVCRQRHDAFGAPTPIPFRFVTDDGEVMTFYGYVNRKPVLAFDNPTWDRWQITVAVPDPMIYVESVSSSGLIQRPSGGGTTWPVTWPANWGASTGGAVAVSNYGNADTWPTFTLRGAMTRPRIYSRERQQSFTLNLTLAPTDVVVIDMKRKTVVLNGTTNILSARTDDSAWFSLPPGDNLVTFSTSNDSDTGSMEMLWQVAYLGL